MVIASILNHQQPDSDQLKICLDNELGAEDFSVPSLAMVYESMVNAYSEPREEDFLVTILKDAHYQTEQNKNYLFQLFDEGSSIRNESLKYHARVLKKLSFERQQFFLIGQMGACLQKGESYEELLEDLEKLESDISEYENDEKNIFGHGIEEWWQSFDKKRGDGY